MSVFSKPASVMRVAPQYQPILARELGIDADLMLKHPLIKPWRRLNDRENCILDATLIDGRHVRWHVKRYPPNNSFTTPADDEVAGHRSLTFEKIPTADLVAFGKLANGYSFVIFDDLAGYKASDKLIESGTPFETLLFPTADLAARLHRANLHHRDLYLCHFFAKVDGPTVDIRFIDTARVKRLPGVFTRGRWIIKDLAQFWYSTTKLPITDEQRTKWLDRYCEQRGVLSGSLRKRIERKSDWIGAHDEKLNRQQPNRNVSIPRA